MYYYEGFVISFEVEFVLCNSIFYQKNHTHIISQNIHSQILVKSNIKITNISNFSKNLNQA